MNRLILALLALFAGIAAQSTSVQARILGTDVTAIGSSDSQRNARTGQVPTAQTEMPVLRQVRARREGARLRPARSRVVIPTVLFSIDRSFE